MQQLAASNQFEQSSTTEVLSSAGNVQPEVRKKRKRQPLGGKKRSQKRTENADHMSAEVKEGTWEVSSRNENSEKNVVRIRRQHRAAIPDMCQEPAACPTQETAPNQSQVLYEATCDAEERRLIGETGDMTNEQVVYDSHEPVEGTVNPEGFETPCSNADAPNDSLETNVDSFVSANGTDVSGSWTTVARPKRRKKVTVSREGCRKSQRRSSRQREADSSVDNVPSSTSTAEVKTSDLCKKDTCNADDENEPCKVSMGLEVQQEQVMPAQTSTDVDVKTEPTAVIYDSVIFETDVGMASSNSSVLNRGTGTNASVDNYPKPTTSTDNLVPDATTGLVNRQSTTDSSEDLSLSNSASDNSSCRGGNIQPTIPTWNKAGNSVLVKVENDAVKRESDSPSCSFLAADFNTSTRPSNAASPLNTCLSETFLETIVSPEEQRSRSSVVRSVASDGTGKETERPEVAETSVSVDAAVVRPSESCESDSEEVCKTILEEVVASVVKEACLMSVSEENDRDVDSAARSSGQASQNAAIQKESDGSSEEMPLKKRRGRRVFADRQPGDTVTASHRSGGDRRAGVSTLASSQRRKLSGSSSRRHSPRGNKYVGAHTSVVGRLLWNF